MLLKKKKRTDVSSLSLEKVNSSATIKANPLQLQARQPCSSRNRFSMLWQCHAVKLVTYMPQKRQFYFLPLLHFLLLQSPCLRVLTVQGYKKDGRYLILCKRTSHNFLMFLYRSQVTNFTGAIVILLTPLAAIYKHLQYFCLIVLLII